ncbi:MAG: hypothetical protein JWR02_1480 [Mucilaginibacter sp.]|nr:hypothetical protein [Mucilaginibacter sp.]
MIRNFLSNLNPRQLVVYFIANWLFIYAFHTLANLYDHSFLFGDYALQNRAFFTARFNTDVLIIDECGVAGLIVAYLIEWKISSKQKWFWANSVVVFVVMFLLYNYHLLGWSRLKPIAFAPGLVFGPGSIAALITDFIVMAAIGCFLLLHKSVINYIDRGIKSTKKRSPAERVSLAELKKIKNR